MAIDAAQYRELKPGDTVTDAKGNSVELIEARDSGFTGRRIGHLNDSAFGFWSHKSLQFLTVKVWTLEEKEALRDSRPRLINPHISDSQYVLGVNTGDELEVDSAGVKVARSEFGAFVQAWVWVPNEHAQPGGGDYNEKTYTRPHGSPEGIACEVYGDSGYGFYTCADDVADAFPGNPITPTQNPLFVMLDGMTHEKLIAKGFFL